jgi:hypothetical protein
MRLPRPTYANVCSTIALFLAAGGTAWAAATLPAGSVTTREIQNGTIRGVDVRNGSLTSADFAALTLLRGVRGETGADGAPGAPGTPGATGASGLAGQAGTAGTDGRNASEPLRSGETVYGVSGGNDWVGTGGITNYVSLPAPAPTALDNTHVNTAEGFDADPECTGSAASPTAPAGKVCIYFFQWNAAACQNEQGYVSPELGRYGFVFTFHQEGVLNCVIQAVWAYTAP